MRRYCLAVPVLACAVLLGSTTAPLRAQTASGTSAAARAKPGPSQGVRPSHAALAERVQVVAVEPRRTIAPKVPATAVLKLIVERPDGTPAQAPKATAWIRHRLTHAKPLKRGRLELRGDLAAGGFSILVWEPEQDLAVLATPRGEDLKEGVLTVRLAKGIAVRGRLLTDKGKPLANVNVRLTIRGDYVRHAVIAPGEYGFARTDAQGRFALRSVLPKVARSLSAAPKGYSRWNRHLLGKAAKADIDLGEIRLEPSDRVLEGVVLDVQARPVAGVTVTAQDRTAQTDKQGRFKLTELPRGRTHINATAQTAGRHVQASVVAEEGQRSVAILLLPRDQRIKMTHRRPPIHVSRWVQSAPTKDGLGDRTVLLYRIGSERIKEHGAILNTLASLAARHANQGLTAVCLYPPATNPEAVTKEIGPGRAHLVVGIDQPAAPGARIGLTDAFAEAAGLGREAVTLFDRGGSRLWSFSGSSQWSSYQDRLRRQTLEAVQAIDVRVTVLAPDGKPAAGVRLVPLCRDASRWLRHGPVTDPQGVLTLRALRGSQPIPIFGFDAQRNLAGKIEASGQGRVEATMRLHAPPELQVRVVDPAGKPLPKARIHVRLSFTGPNGGVAVRGKTLLTNARGSCAVGWLPPEARVALSVSAEAHWTEDIRVPQPDAKGRRILKDIVLLRADKALELRVIGLDGKPIPQLGVSVGTVNGRTDADGVVKLAGLPGRSVQVSIHGGGIRSTQAVLEPGRRIVAVARSADIEQIRGGRRGDRAPPWRVSQWIAGKPVQPSDIEGRAAIVALADEAMSAEDRKTLLAAVLKWHARHGPAGLTSVFLFPANTDPQQARALLGGRTDVSVGIDAPVNNEEGAPGYTSALWRGWNSWALPCYLQESANRVHRYHRSQGMAKALARLDAAVAQAAGRIPTRFVLVVTRPDGKPAEGVHAQAYSDSTHQWTALKPVSAGRLAGVVPAPRQELGVLAWAPERNLIAAASLSRHAFQAKPELRLPLERGISIRGTIGDEKGGPLGKAKVTLTLRLGQRSHTGVPGYGTFTTAADGRFVLGPVLASTARRISVSLKGYTPWQRALKQADLAADLDLGAVKIEPSDRVVMGIAMDRDGVPLPDVRVHARTSVAVSGPDGRFTLKGLPRVQTSIHANGRIRGEHASANAHVRPARGFVGLVLVTSMEARRLRYHMPPIRAGAWVQGAPPASGLTGNTVALYLVGRERHKDHNAILKTLSDLAKRHTGQPFLAVCLYPADAKAETVKADAAAAPGLLMGIDKPVSPGKDFGFAEALSGPYGLRGQIVLLFDRTGRRQWNLYRGNSWTTGRSTLPAEVLQVIDSTDAHVTVLGEDGRPVPGVRLLPVAAHADRLFGDMPTTDTKGQCLLGGVRGGETCAVYGLDTKNDRAGRVALRGKGAVEVTMRLAKPPALTGRVVDDAGRPAAGASVRVTLHPKQADGRTMLFYTRKSLRCGPDGGFRIGWVPPEIGVRLQISGSGFWPERQDVPPAPKPQPRHAGDITLYRANKPLDLRVLGLKGQPLAGVRVHFSHGSSQTDKHGQASLANLPNKPVRVYLSGHGGGQAQIYLAPGKRAVAIATSDEVRKAVGPGQSGVPQWRVATWVVGPPVTPESIGNDAAVLAMARRDMPASHRQALLNAVIRWQRQYGDRLAASICIFPAGADADEIKKLAGEAQGVSVAIDSPVTQAPGAPGYTEALWRGWRAWSFPCYLQTPNRQSQYVPDNRDIRAAIERLDALAKNALGRLPLSSRGRLARLRAEAGVLWERKDPVEADIVWLALRHGFSRYNTATKELRVHEKILGLTDLNPVGAAFTQKLVIFGTARGPIVYARATRAWSRLAPGGRFDLMEAPVTKISQDGERVLMVLRAKGGEVARWEYDQGKWSPR